MRRLTKLVESGALMPIDAELGALLTRRSAARLGQVEDARLVGLAGAMLSAERARGHSCLDLDALVGGAMPHTDVIGRMLPDVAGWRSLLSRSGVCGDGTTTSPLVIDGGRLYLSRYHAAECRLAAAIRARVAAREQTSPDAATVSLFRKLFPQSSDGATDWQAVAAAAAMRGGLTVITGGPGTGKTTTVARILALLLQRTPDLRVALAAPTGKAAARLAESVLAGVRGLTLGEELAARIPAEGRTLHRLLGYRPWNDEFAHGTDEPLAEDVVIVDEASMVDVLMMDALFAALRPTARIILLGDQDQLASVDTGFVLGRRVPRGRSMRRRARCWTGGLGEASERAGNRDRHECGFAARCGGATHSLVPVRQSARHRRAVRGHPERRRRWCDESAGGCREPRCDAS